MKTKHLYILILLISFSINAQLLENSLWRIDKIFGYDGETLTEYNLTKVEQTDGKSSFVYGNSISFQKGKFHSQYSAPCGNDCFPLSQGTYKIVDDSHIEITQLTFDRSGDCLGIHMKIKKINRYQIIQKSETEIMLKKTIQPILDNLPK